MQPSAIPAAVIGVHQRPRNNLLVSASPHVECLQEVLVKSCRPLRAGRDHLDIAYTVMANMQRLDRSNLTYTYILEHVRGSPAFMFINRRGGPGPAVQHNPGL